MTKFHTETARSFPLHSIFTHPFGHSRPVFDAPNDGGAGGGAGDPPAPEKKDPPANPPSDADAKLLKENMKQKTEIGELKAQVKLWEGLDPAAVRKLVDDAAAAEAKRQEDETKAAEARGEFERVKASMNEQSAAALQAEQGKTTAVQGQLDAALKTIEELTVGASFSNSGFVREKLVLTPSIARKEFGEHFESVEGKTVGYDKPKGASERTMLVDAAGKPLSFEAAIEKLVDAHPEKERLRKGTMVPGAGSKTSDNTKQNPSGANSGELSGKSRIEAILAARRKA